MELPKNTEIKEWESATAWFDESGILYSISKKVPPQTIEQAKKSLADLYEFMGERKKICLLVDATNSSESTKEVRDYAAGEFPKFIKALAIISNSALGRMLANLFFSVKAQPYPVKMFKSEKEAKEWLKQYL